MQIRGFVALALLVFGCRLSAAEDGELRASTPAVRKEIVATIDGQLAAFRKGDVPKAYAYSATALRVQKPLPVFTAIVRANYPEIWSNTRSECGIVRDDGDRAAVLVHVFASNANASYDYTLVKEANGWRIEGVLRHQPVEEEKL